MVANNCKQLLFLAVLAVGICAAICDTGVEDGVMAMPFSTAATVRTQLMNYVNQRQTAAPANVYCSTCLIRAWHRRHKSSRMLTFHISNLESAIRPYPKLVQDKLRALVYASSNSFENFDVKIRDSYAIKTAYIGAARKVNNVVDVAILDVDLTAALVTKYIRMSRRVCRKILFWKKCKTVYFNSQRGYYSSEINGMVAMLQHEAFKAFKEIVVAMPA